MKKTAITLRSAVTARLPLFVFLLFLLQPLMDVLSFWITELEVSNLPTLVLRFGVLGLTLLAGFGISRRKWIYWTAAGIIGLLTAGHIFALAQFGISDLFGDLTNLVRVLQMPLTALCLITFLRENDKCYDAMKWGMVACLLLTLAVEVLATLTHTEPHTYMDGKGYLGWFNNTNSQSNNLCMLVPVAAVWSYEKKGWKHPLFWLCLVGGFAAMYFMGPRLSYFGIAATGLGLGLSILLIDKKRWRETVALVCLVAVFAALLPTSPMVKHQKIYDGVQSDRQKQINEYLASLDLPALREEGLTAEETARREQLWIEALTPVYTEYTEDFVEIFGAEKAIRMHDFSYSIIKLTALRPKKLKYAALLMEDSPASARVFGLELSRFTAYNGEIYDVENDFHGIYYLYGWAGLAAMLAFMGYFLVLILKALFKDAKKFYTLDAAAWGIGLVCCLIHVYCTAGVLRRPNASFFLSAAFAAVYYLVKLKKYDMPQLEAEKT